MTVKMTIGSPVTPGGPTTADVHVDEVENWKRSGWVVAKDQPEQQSAKKQGRKS